jgi:hypothetical protein
VKQKNKDQIVVSFSGSVGKDGLMRIKSFIELLESQNKTHKKKVSQTLINKLADDVNEAAWKKFKKEKGLQ